MLFPQQNAIRNLCDLSGLWDFQLDPENRGEQEGWHAGLPAARLAAVPGSWNEQFEDAYNYLGAAWYLHRFYVPAGWRGQSIFVRIGSANYAAKVWLNNSEVGSHEGGHLPFEFDITDQLRWDEENVIAIQVENELKPTRVPPGNSSQGMAGFAGSLPNASFDFFPFAGLHRPVLLYSVPQQRITDVTVTAHMDGTVQIRVQGTGDIAIGQAQLTGSDEPLTAQLAFSSGIADVTLRVPSPRLWSPEDPYLYTLTLTVEQDGRIVDRYSLPVGIRTVEVQGARLLLNGKQIFLQGVGRHEDFYASGRGFNLPLMVKDNSLLKWLGANSYRTSHYPYSEEEMMLADRAGFLIIDETPVVGMGFDDSDADVTTRLQQALQQTRDLIARDKNHPSVIMWSVANEPLPPGGFAAVRSRQPVQLPTIAVDFLKQLLDLARSLDPTRPVTFAAVGAKTPEWLALVDVICINRYYGWYSQSGHLDAAFAQLEREFDDLYEANLKPIIMTEFGADALPGVHRQPPVMWSEEYQWALIKGYLDAAAKRDYVAGMHIWNFADFQTGQSIMRAAAMNHKGIFTRAREPKLAATMLHERWNGQ